MIDSGKLIGRLIGWELWRRLVLTLKWAPRGATIGGLAGLVLALAGRIWPLMSESELAVLAWGAVGIGVLAALVYIWIRPFPRMVLARRFDLILGLKERISTALEAASGELEIGHVWRRRLADDLMQQMPDINISTALPPKVEIRVLPALIVVIGLLWTVLWLPNPAAVEAVRRRRVADAVAGSVAEIEAMLSELESLERVPEEVRREASALMMDSLEVLSRPDLSLEEALAALADTEDALRALADTTDEELQQVLQEAASQSVGTELADMLAQALQGGELDDMAALFEGMSEEQLRQMAEVLTQTAQSLDELSPEAAERLAEAAAALAGGDSEAAQAALSEASEALARAIQENERMAEAARRMADRLREERGSIATAGSEYGGTSSAGASPGSQEPTAAGGEGQAGGSPASGGGDSLGEGTAPGGELSTGFTVPEGERQYEPIYAPEHIGGTGGEILELPGTGEPGGQPLEEGEILHPDAEDALVPYSEVWSDYAEFAREAFHNEHIPLSLRDVIREYFSSLQP